MENKSKKFTEIKLNQKQQEAYDLIMKGNNLFITGLAGTGKSVIIKYFVEKNYLFKNIGVTSTTGVSALVIGGNTLYSFLGIGLGTESEDILIKRIYNSKKIRNRWEKLDILIIDEISMLSPQLFDKLESIARKIRSKNILLDQLENPFGGIQLILTGDFLQLPVVNNDNFCFESKSWSKCIDNIVYLTEIVRQNDITFQNILNEIRLGKVSEKTKKILNQRIKIPLINNDGIKPTKIFTTNIAVDQLNNQELYKLDGDIFEYDMTFDFFDINLTSLEKNRLIEKYSKNTIAPSTLQLCKGAQVMLVFNLDVENGLVNGSRGVVVDFCEDSPIVKFINGSELLIENNSWDIKEADQLIMRINQLPLKLAWAFTIHKSQAITLDYAEIDLGNMFTYGQAYVALSRVKNINGLSLININYDKIQSHPKAIDFYKKLELNI